jgi:CBS domain-containing protein/sporulation protein YlmC with PRC-barrel domain
MSYEEKFFFLSQIIGKPVFSSSGKQAGKLFDLVTERSEIYPLALGVIISAGKRKTPSYVSWNSVNTLFPEITLNIESENQFLPLSQVNENMALREELLDKQIVDTHGAKVERVNDLHLLLSSHQVRLAHVDVGLRGLMRRVGWERMIDRTFEWLFAYKLPNRFISWKFVHTLSTNPNCVRLTISQRKLEQLHPADLADIMEDLSIHDRVAIFNSLDIETAAEALEETDPKIQKSLIETVSPEKASDILDEMSPTEAADLLSDLSPEKAGEILKGMEQEKANDVKELLTYNEETAGGLMTTSYLTISPETTVDETLNMLRTKGSSLDIVYYVYIVDTHEALQGVVSIKELLRAKPENLVSEIYEARLIFAKVDDTADDLAEIFAKYSIRAIPVVDEMNHLKGVIRFKTILEILAPELGK